MLAGAACVVRRRWMYTAPVVSVKEEAEMHNEFGNTIQTELVFKIG